MVVPNGLYMCIDMHVKAHTCIYNLENQRLPFIYLLFVKTMTSVQVYVLCCTNLDCGVVAVSQEEDVSSVAGLGTVSDQKVFRTWMVHFVWGIYCYQ